MAEVEEPVDDIVADEEAEEVEDDEEEEFVAVGATEVKLFGKWSFDDIEIRDISLEVSAFKYLVVDVDVDLYDESILKVHRLRIVAKAILFFNVDFPSAGTHSN